MAKLTIQRLLEVSKLLATEAGEQLSELLTFVNDVSDQVLRALRNGLTFKDNFNCDLPIVKIKHNEETEVSTGDNRPSGVMPLKVVSTKYGIDQFSWWVSNQGKLVVKIAFTSDPGLALEVRLLILYE